MATNYARGDRPVPDFELVQPLGRGGFGVVWKAKGPGGIEAALKIINLTAKQGFKEFRGLQRVKNIRHPNLVFLYGFWLKDEYGNMLDGKAVDDQDSAVFAETIRGTLRSPVESLRPAELIIAMGLGDKTLADRLQECNQQGRAGIPVEELLPYMEDAARGIDHLNTSSVQHCDIKPSNIMIVGGAVQVCDFGLARLMGDVKATSPAMSVAYSAPEVLERNEPSPTTDQYSLAITYHELRTGALPFPEASPLQVMHFHMRGELDYSRLAPGEQEVIRKATSLDPSRRYTGSVQMVRALRRACQSDSGPAGSGQALYAPPFDVPPTASSSALRPGEIVPGYRLLRELAQSASDHVWLAQGVEGEVAMLVRDLNESPAIDLAALDVIKGLEHNRLTELRAYWLLDATGNVVLARPDDRDALAEAAQVVVLGRLARKTLQQVLDEHHGETGSGLDGPVALRYLRQVAEAVDFLNAPIHEVSGRRVSIQHRAVRPENVMCFGDSVKLGNFLSACLLQGPLTITDRPPESNQVYNAPETRDKVVTRWSDQYSLAVMYYQLRSGTLPSPEFRPGGEVAARGGAAPLDLSLLPDAERAVVAQATSANPKDRFNSCLELAEALQRAMPAEEKLPEVEEEEVEEAEEHGSGAFRAPEIDLSFLGPEPSEEAQPRPLEVAPSASAKLAEAPPAAATSDEPFRGGTLEIPTPVRDTRGGSPLEETVSEKPQAMPPPPAQLPMRDSGSGLLDGRYQLLEQVGEGAFAVVYRAKDSRLNKDVAVKVLKIEHTTDPARLVQLRDLFQREARMSARLEDPNIVHVSDAHVTPSGIPYLVTEFLEGRLFREVIATESPLELPRIDALLEQLCSAVDTAHEENIVHRDLKPGNLMLVYSRSGERLKVLDFGLAKLVDQAHMSLTQGAPIGTPHYMSPEQHRGEDATALSDIYAVGVILFEMLTGRLPFDAPDLEGMEVVHELRRLHCEAEPPNVTADRPDLPAELNAVIRKALAKDPPDRFGTAAELLAAFREAVAPRRSEAVQRPTEPTASAPAAPSRRWVKAAVVVVAVAVAAVFAAPPLVHYFSSLSGHANEPPVAVVNYTVDAQDSQTINFSAKGSTDRDGTIAKVRWNLGDHSEPLEGVEVPHEYSQPGDYEVSVTVVDNQGAETKKTLTLHVEPRTKPEADLREAYALFRDAQAEKAAERFASLRDEPQIKASPAHLASARLGYALALWMLQSKHKEDATAAQLESTYTQLEAAVRAGDLSDRDLKWRCLALLRGEPKAFLSGLRELHTEGWFQLDDWLQELLAQRAQHLRSDALAQGDDPELLQQLMDYFEAATQQYDTQLGLKRVELLVQQGSWTDARPALETLRRELQDAGAPAEQQRRAETLWLTATVRDPASPADSLVQARKELLNRTGGADAEPQALELLVDLYHRDAPNKQFRSEVLSRLVRAWNNSLAKDVGELVEEEVRDALTVPNPFRRTELVQWARKVREQNVAGDVTLVFLAESALDASPPDLEAGKQLLQAIPENRDRTDGYVAWARGMARAQDANPRAAIEQLDLAFQQEHASWQTPERKEAAAEQYQRAGHQALADDANQAYQWLQRAARLSRDSTGPVSLRLDLADAAVRKQPPDLQAAIKIADGLANENLSQALRFRALLMRAQALAATPDPGKASEAYLKILDETEKRGGELADLSDAATKEYGNAKPYRVLFDLVVEPGLKIGQQWRSKAGDDPQAARVVARLYGHKGRLIYENLYEEWPFKDALSVALESYRTASELDPPNDAARGEFYVWQAYLFSLRVATKEDAQKLLDLAEKAEQAGPELSGAWFVEGLGHHYEALYALNDQQAALKAEKNAIDSLTKAITKAEAETPAPQPELREAYYRTRSAALVIEANYLLDIDANASGEARDLLEQSLADADRLCELVDPGDSEGVYRAQMARGNALEDLAWRCGQHGRYDEAIGAFENAAKAVALTRPDDVRARVSMGRVNFKRYAESGIHEPRYLQDAVTDLERAVTAKQDDEQVLAEGHLWLGAAKILSKDYDGGIEQISKGIELAQAEWLRLALRVVAGTELPQAQQEKDKDKVAAGKLAAAVRNHCQQIVGKSAEWQRYVVRLVVASWVSEGKLAEAVRAYETALASEKLSSEDRVALLVQKVEFRSTWDKKSLVGNPPPILRDMDDAVSASRKGAVSTVLRLRALNYSAKTRVDLENASGASEDQRRAYLRDAREQYDEMIKLDGANPDAWNWYMTSGYCSAQLFTRLGGKEEDRQMALQRLKVAKERCPSNETKSSIEMMIQALQPR